VLLTRRKTPIYARPQYPRPIDLASPRLQIAGSVLTVTTLPLKNLISGQEIVTAVFDRIE
jgi:hypothetical protein